jgi:histidinol dehydrogenase
VTIIQENKMPDSVRLLKLSALVEQERKKLLRRAEIDIGKAIETVQPMIAAIRQEGNAALLHYVRQFDSKSITPDNIEVTATEIATAKARLAPEVTQAIRHAFTNIRKVHAGQLRESITITEVEPGVMAGEKVTAIPRIGLYVPRGKGAFPSVMLMLATPALVAGVPEVIVCTPPTPEGRVDDASLVAADLCGVHRIFKIGGAQAIAAMALGTTVVPKVDKLMGPCSAYGAAAKRLLAGEVNIGMPAGPSESIVLADESTDPELAAYDLLVEAEHGSDSAALLVTHNGKLATRVQSLLPELLAKLPEQRRQFCLTGLNSYGGILLTDSLEDSLAFINEYAPEHLLLQVDDPWALVDRVQNAGEILLGENATFSLGNFAIGVNAVLPTGGFARSYSATSIRDFQKSTSLAYVTRKGFASLALTVIALAEEEGFPAHAAAVKVRMGSRS